MIVEKFLKKMEILIVRISLKKFTLRYISFLFAQKFFNAKEKSLLTFFLCEFDHLMEKILDYYIKTFLNVFGHDFERINITYLSQLINCSPYPGNFLLKN